MIAKAPRPSMARIGAFHCKGHDMTIATLPPPARPSPATAAPATAQPMVYRFSVEQYHQLIEAGILREGERVELIDGWILSKMIQNPPHVFAMRKSDKRITRELPAGWCVRPQVPITTDLSEPEPVLAIVRGDDSDYATRHPGPADVATLIEIAESSLSLDRTVKLPAYARAQIPIYWIINLVDQEIEVYSDPAVSGAAASYRNRQIYRRGDAVPLVLDGKQVASIPVDDLLP
jgi:Uma2 family endonuclease